MNTPQFCFEDATGRPWRVVLTCRTVIEAERHLGVKILDLFDDATAEAQRLDPLARFEALVFVLEPEFHRHGVTRADFERAMPKASFIAAAWQAFYVAVHRFLPERQRGAVIGSGRRSMESDGLHDSSVAMIWHLAGWCGVEPWHYTLAELQAQAKGVAIREGRAASTRAATAAGATTEIVRPLRDLSPQEQADLFRPRS